MNQDKVRASNQLKVRSRLEETLAAATKDRRTVESDGTQIAKLSEGVSFKSVPTHADERGSVVEL